MIKKNLSFITFVVILISCQTMSIKQADVDNASKIYFIPLHTNPMTAELTVREPGERSTDPMIIGPTERKESRIENPMLPPEKFNELNALYFEKMKSIFGSKLQMIPEKFKIRKKVFASEIDSWDFENLDCDLYILFEFETPGALRSASYTVRDTDFNKESYYASPMVADLKLMIYSLMPGEKATKLFHATHKILGFHEMVIEGSIDMGKAIEQKVSGEEVKKTASVDIPETDYFHWTNQYISDMNRLERDFKEYTLNMSRIMMKRAEDGADFFVMKIEESLAQEE